MEFGPISHTRYGLWALIPYWHSKWTFQSWQVPANSTFVVSVSLKPHPTDEGAVPGFCGLLRTVAHMAASISCLGVLLCGILLNLLGPC